MVGFIVDKQEEVPLVIQQNMLTHQIELYAPPMSTATPSIDLAKNKHA